MFKNIPIIGIMPLYDKEKDSYWMIPGYMKSLEEAGAIPMMLPLTERAEELDYFLETCDGFLLTGGQDVTPELYREERKPVCGETSALRDSMDKYIFTHAVQVYMSTENSVNRSLKTRSLLTKFGTCNITATGAVTI